MIQRENPSSGMNPFMERTWPDVHLALIAEIRSELGIELPSYLSAKGEQQVNVLGGEVPFSVRMS